MRYREEVINVKLAELLREYGLRADPETIERGVLPDVMISLEGIKVNLEGRFADSPQAANLIEKVKERIKENIADIGVAVYYPKDLREAADLDKLTEKLRTTNLRANIIYYAASGLKKSSIGKINIGDLVETIQNVFHMIVKNDIIREKVKEVGEIIEKAVILASEEGLFFNSESLIKELKNVLGIKED